MRILRGISSRVLACGCIAGVYETYDGRVVTVIDAINATCQNGQHAAGKIVPANAVDEAAVHTQGT